MYDSNTKLQSWYRTMQRCHFYLEIYENSTCSLQDVTNMKKQGREINAN